ncbi:FkbM family methyltransferase [bacterium]|nr:FkbM family methyltransferase [bacterium]
MLIIRLRDRLFDIYAAKSYSHEGEDMILSRMFSGKAHGFYVDIGAHHPRRFSNTYLFYRRGWRGMNIEPNPDIADAFRKERKRDINLQVGISDRDGILTYYLLDDPALNSFDRELTASRVATTPYKVTSTKKISVQRLDAVLRSHLPSGTKIDLLSIDTEGLDMAVLQSSDWDVFRPACVLVESLDTTLEKAMQGEIFMFMKARGYELFGKTYNTLILREQEGTMPGGEST